MQPGLAVYIRIGLYLLSGRLLAGNWIPEDVKPMLVSPEMVEATTGYVVAGTTLVWYHFSQAHRALVKLVRGDALDR